MEKSWIFFLEYITDVKYLIGSFTHFINAVNGTEVIQDSVCYKFRFRMEI